MGGDHFVLCSREIRKSEKMTSIDQIKRQGEEGGKGRSRGDAIMNTGRSSQRGSSGGEAPAPATYHLLPREIP